MVVSKNACDLNQNKIYAKVIFFNFRVLLHTRIYAKNKMKAKVYE